MGRGRDKAGIIRRLRDRDGDNCGICGLVMRFTDYRKRPRVSAIDATIDHVLERSNGGTFHSENLRLAHAACNNARNPDYPQSAELVRERVALSICQWLNFRLISSDTAAAYVVAMRRYDDWYTTWGRASA